MAERQGDASRPQGAANERGGTRASAARAWSLLAAKTLIVAGLVVLVDWVSKRAVESSFVQGEERRLLPGVQLVYTRNHGVAFGLLPGAGVYAIVALAVAVLVLLVYFVARAGRGPVWLATGLLIGGAVGNILDRLRDGAVTDFVKLPLHWPAFNLADAAITIGVLLLVLFASRPDDGGADGQQGAGAAGPR